MKKTIGNIFIYMKNQWIQFLVVEMFLTLAKQLDYGALPYKYLESSFSSEIPILVGSDVLIGIFMWSMGMDFVKKAGLMNLMIPVSGKERKMMFFGYPVITAAIAAGVETAVSYVIFRDCYKVSLIRYFRFLFGHGTYDQEGFFRFFLAEMFLFYICFLFGMLLRYLWEKIGTKAMILGTVFLAFCVGIAGSFASKYQEKYVLASIRLVNGSVKNIVSAEQGDCSNYFNFISEEEMNSMLHGIKYVDVTFSFPYTMREKEGIPPIPVSGVMKATKMNMANSAFLGIPSDPDVKLVERLDVVSRMGYGQLEFGNGLTNLATVKELEQHFGPCKKIEQGSYEHYVFTDGNGCYIDFWYRGLEDEENEMPYLVSMFVEDAIYGVLN